MSKEVIMRLEIGDNLRGSIDKVIEATEKENKRSQVSRSPGYEVEKAFGIDFTKIAKKAMKLEKEKMRIDASYDQV